MLASPEETRFMNLAVKIAYGLQGTKRPEWFIDELVDDLVDTVWLQPKVREDAAPRARFILRKFCQMESQPMLVKVRHQQAKAVP